MTDRRNRCRVSNGSGHASSSWSIITGRSTAVMWPIDVEEVEAQTQASTTMMRTKRTGRQWSGKDGKDAGIERRRLHIAWRCRRSIGRRATDAACGWAPVRVAGNEWADCQRLASDSIVIKTTHRSTHYTTGHPLCLPSVYDALLRYSIINAPIAAVTSGR